MNKESLKDDAWRMDFMVSMNQDYYQFLTFWFAFADRTMRVLVGILAVAGLLTSVLSSWSTYAIAVSIISLAMAMILNIVPIQGYERKFAEIYQRYTSLRARVRRVHLRAFGEVLTKESMVRLKDKLIAENVSKELATSVEELAAEIENLQGEEVWDLGWLSRRCQRRERQRRWGPHIVTHADELKEMERIRAQIQQRETMARGSAPAA